VDGNGLCHDLARSHAINDIIITNNPTERNGPAQTPAFVWSQMRNRYNKNQKKSHPNIVASPPCVSECCSSGISLDGSQRNVRPSAQTCQPPFSGHDRHPCTEMSDQREPEVGTVPTALVGRHQLRPKPCRCRCGYHCTQPIGVGSRGQCGAVDFLPVLLLYSVAVAGMRVARRCFFGFVFHFLPHTLVRYPRF